MKQLKYYSIIRFFPKISYFEYCTRDSDNIGEVELTKEEMMAINLRDVKGYSKKKCSKQMDISIKEFEKIISEARKKVALVLVEKDYIKIYTKEETKEDENLEDVKVCKFRCATCGCIYYVNYEIQEIICPKCKSTKVMSNEDAGFCKKWSNKK